MIDLVTFNVTVQDQETGKPIEDLGYEDFQVFDNGHPIEARIFEHGRSHDPRPRMNWSQCDSVGRRRQVNQR